MAIFGIEGGIGTGKTLTGVYLAYQDLMEGKRLFTNVKFRNLLPKYNKKITYLSKDIIAEMFNKIKDGSLNMKNSCVLIQEMHNYMDSRMSGSKKNRTLSYWVLQSRHTGQGSCDIVYDTQDLGQVDLRLRNNTDYVLHPLIVRMDDDKPDLVSVQGFVKLAHKYTNFGFSFDCSDLINIYDTHEVVDF